MQNLWHCRHFCGPLPPILVIHFNMVNCWVLIPGFCPQDVKYSRPIWIETQPEVLEFDNLEMSLETHLTVSSIVMSELRWRDLCRRTWAIKAAAAADLISFSFTQSDLSSAWFYQSFFRAQPSVKPVSTLTNLLMSVFLIHWSVSHLSEHMKPHIRLVLSSLWSTPSSLPLCGSVRTLNESLMISSQPAYRRIVLLLFLFGTGIISWQCDDTPFSAGQMSSDNYVNHRGGREVEEGIAAVQGTANVIFCVWMCVCKRETETWYESHTLLQTGIWCSRETFASSWTESQAQKNVKRKQESWKWNNWLELLQYSPYFCPPSRTSLETLFNTCKNSVDQWYLVTLNRHTL